MNNFYPTFVKPLIAKLVIIHYSRSEDIQNSVKTHLYSVMVLL